jgi:flagellar motor switch protein FliG
MSEVQQIAGLGDAERAAIMIMLLEEEQAATILSQLGPQELQVLGEMMCGLGDIGPEQITQAIAGFGSARAAARRRSAT